MNMAIHRNQRVNYKTINKHTKFIKKNYICMFKYTNKMSDKEEIVHKGVINNINGGDVDVGIQCFSACAACHANQICNMAETKEKKIKINDANGDYTIGETVRVAIKRSQGYKALFLGYVLPFLIFFFVLSICSIFLNELAAGIVALCILLPYYYMLYLKRERISKAFTFKLEKI